MYLIEGNFSNQEMHGRQKDTPMISTLYFLVKHVKKFGLYIFILLALIGVSGCDLSLVEKDVKIGPFNASYYSKTKTEPIFEELVEIPSLNYAFDKFHGIDSKEFRAEWVGDIEVYKSEKIINIGFDVSRADVSLYVDEKLVESWSKSNKTISVNLAKGTHKIKIKYKNNWHTVGFNTSFSSYPTLNIESAKKLLAKDISDSAKIVYIGAYESADTYNKIFVSMKKIDIPIVLILSSNNAANWIIDSEMLPNLEAILVGSRNGSSTVKNIDSKVSIFSLKDLANEYKSYRKVKMDIKRMLDREPDYLFGEYSMASVVIPQI